MITRTQNTSLPGRRQVLEGSLSGPDLKTECDLEPMPLRHPVATIALGFLALQR